MDTPSRSRSSSVPELIEVLEGSSGSWGCAPGWQNQIATCMARGMAEELAALMSVVGLERGRHPRHGDGHRRLRRAGLAEVHGADQKALDRAARELNAVLRARPVRFG